MIKLVPFYKTLFFIAFLVLNSCSKNPEMKLSEAVLFPKPVDLNETNSSFQINEKTKIFISDDSKELLQAGNYLVDLMHPSTGFKTAVEHKVNAKSSNSIVLKISKLETKFGKEGYVLSISEDQVIIEASSAEGVFRGIQTFRQALPTEIESQVIVDQDWFVATGEIKDYPEYNYRGAMLDVARHFFSVEDVKRYIDLISMYKINVLHLHLSDDQGWRIEIKSWPNLTKHGGSLQVGGGKGGFYTQEQYKDIVNYAAKRYITIIPEIDIPGHTNAALASYPELNCNGKATELYTGTEVGFSTLCTDKEITYKFVDDVVRELAAITPGDYIHIGGDESHVTEIDDYIYFINKVQDIVIAHNKKVIGWDEIALADIKENTVVQFWAKTENALKGVEKKGKVLMSPSTKVYLDMKYDSLTKIGLSWAATIELDSAYLWTPETFVKGISKKDIIGIESPLWTETIVTMKDIEYMAFPRIIGHSEIGWTSASNRNWEDYISRLKKHTERLKVMGVNYYNSDLLLE